jgi:hypothetical protein
VDVSRPPKCGKSTVRSCDGPLGTNNFSNLLQMQGDQLLWLDGGRFGVDRADHKRDVLGEPGIGQRQIIQSVLRIGTFDTPGTAVVVNKVKT